MSARVSANVRGRPLLSAVSRVSGSIQWPTGSLDLELGLRRPKLRSQSRPGRLQDVRRSANRGRATTSLGATLSTSSYPTDPGIGDSRAATAIRPRSVTATQFERFVRARISSATSSTGRVASIGTAPMALAACSAHAFRSSCSANSSGSFPKSLLVRVRSCCAALRHRRSRQSGVGAGR